MASASAQPSGQLSEYAGPAVTVVTGDECGLLKRVVLTEGIIAKWGEQDRSQAVLCQDWVAGPGGTNLLAAAHKFVPASTLNCLSDKPCTRHAPHAQRWNNQGVGRVDWHGWL